MTHCILLLQYIKLINYVHPHYCTTFSLNVVEVESCFCKISSVSKIYNEQVLYIYIYIVYCFMYYRVTFRDHKINCVGVWLPFTLIATNIYIKQDLSR